jgi:thiol-disulfide isomerase/thioredoxin
MIDRKITRFIILSITCIVLVFHSINTYAQTIPPFRMQLTNGKNFTAQNVSKTKPVIIIYFAPDCDHCRTLIKAVLKKNSDFKRAQIIMVSFEPLSMVISFEKEFDLKKYPNILCGTELPTFYFKNLFNLVHTPFTALYDKRGKLVVYYKEETPVEDLVLHLKKI